MFKSFLEIRQNSTALIERYAKLSEVPISSLFNLNIINVNLL